jgi:hypothetical protein
VALGVNKSGGNLTTEMDSVEIIDLESPLTSCQPLPNYPNKVYGAIGGLGFSEEPLICGGYPNFSYCYSYQNNGWKESSQAQSLRCLIFCKKLIQAF